MGVVLHGGGDCKSSWKESKISLLGWASSAAFKLCLGWLHPVQLPEFKPQAISYSIFLLIDNLVDIADNWSTWGSLLPSSIILNFLSRFISFMWKVELNRKREKQIFYPLVYFSNNCSSWAGLKPWVWNSIMSSMWEAGAQALRPPPASQRVLAGSWTGSCTTGTPVGTRMS